ncbi:hypothetical protein [Tenacibaculum gallaicum]|nr:hypothetical protein [Tenacibaculum gallaicum]
MDTPLLIDILKTVVTASLFYIGIYYAMKRFYNGESMKLGKEFTYKHRENINNFIDKLRQFEEEAYLINKNSKLLSGKEKDDEIALLLNKLMTEHYKLHVNGDLDQAEIDEFEKIIITQRDNIKEIANGSKNINDSDMCKLDIIKISNNTQSKVGDIILENFK